MFDIQQNVNEYKRERGVETSKRPNQTRPKPTLMKTMQYRSNMRREINKPNDWKSTKNLTYTKHQPAIHLRIYQKKIVHKFLYFFNKNVIHCHYVLKQSAIILLKLITN